jgi:hypothetical protein
MCFALTGSPPFAVAGRSLAQLLMDHQFTAPPDVRDRRRDVPAWLAGLCQRMLAKRPQDRPQGMSAVCQSLERGEAL